MTKSSLIEYFPFFLPFYTIGWKDTGFSYIYSGEASMPTCAKETAILRTASPILQSKHEPGARD